MFHIALHIPSLCVFSTAQLTGSSERALKVTQFHFTAWPDHGVPEYATPILAFHKKIKKHHKPSKGAILVHCRCTNMVVFTDLYVASNNVEICFQKNIFHSFIDKLFAFLRAILTVWLQTMPLCGKSWPFQ